MLVSTSNGGDATAHVLPDGRIEYDGTDLSPVRRRDESEGRFGVNGWQYWYADTPSGLRPLAALRVLHRARGYLVAHPAGENTDQAERGRDQPDL